IIRKMKNIEIQGIYTHFSTADEPDKEYAFQQFNIFNKIVKKVKIMDIDIPFFHTANSSALIELPATRLNLVRPGCAIYGLYPSYESRQKIQLYPALSFKTNISFIKKVKKGSYIGYGRTYKTKKQTLVGTLPVGYADGYPRLLSNQGIVLVRGKSVPVIGRVCMDQTMIDITDIEGVSIGDEVTLWGEQSENTMRIESIAEMLHTIVDEVVHLTDKGRVAKLFIKDGKPWKIKNMLGEYVINEK
ncbi:MAG: alanine racemase, partial [Candidatus Atribacteria bacterium]|nr:alanine racemase [Candidatus Atribacteria bacterium]